MLQAVHRAQVTQRALNRRRYRAAQGPMRGIAVGLTLSTILWLAMLVTWMHFSLA